MKVSKKVVGVEYAIRDIVSVATKLEQQGKKIQKAKSIRKKYEKSKKTSYDI